MLQKNDLPEGESAQLRRYFNFVPNNWPIAALCRQAEKADADVHTWLRADPIYLQAEMHGARVMAWENLGLIEDEQSQILSALRPVFGDFGFELSTSSQGFFYIRTLNASPIPIFADALQSLDQRIMRVDTLHDVGGIFSLHRGNQRFFFGCVNRCVIACVRK